MRIERSSKRRRRRVRRALGRSSSTGARSKQTPPLSKPRGLSLAAAVAVGASGRLLGNVVLWVKRRTAST
ncbi:MAG: hypothetical protein ACQETI_09180 [Halobacteriota archaeon]